MVQGSAGYGAGGRNEPVPQQGDPQGIIRSGDVAVRIEGELVPVVDVELGGQENIYFEHHVLLWKEHVAALRHVSLPATCLVAATIESYHDNQPLS